MVGTSGEARRHRVLWYTLDGDVSAAESILDGMGVHGIDLVGCAHEPFSAPTAAQLEGCEALVGEFCPVLGEEVDVVADAGVRLLASMSIGVNHMDVAGLARRGVLVSNCPGYCAEDVATHAVALMLDLERKVTFSNRDVMAGGWDPKAGYPARRVSGQTLGLVFLGHIARAVIPMATGLGMRVVVWAPTKSAAEVEEAGAEKVGTLDELLAESDVVSLHCPLIPETEHLIGARELALMGEGSFLVNTARGDLVDEDALADALEAGTIRGAGLDTLAHESHDRNTRLIDSPRCIVTPHSGYDSLEAAEELRRMSLEACCQLLVDGVTPTNVVAAG
jgi:D-3-phosphoglycerate dehydrogenase